MTIICNLTCTLTFKTCAHPHCNEYTKRTRTYCSYKHEKQQKLHGMKEIFEDERDLFGVEFGGELLCQSCIPSDNTLQPKEIIGGIRRPVKFEINSALLDFFAPYKELLLTASLGANVDGGETMKRKDQYRRAKALAKALNPKLHDRLSLMMGYGGFLILVMEAIVKYHGRSYLDDLEIQLMDTDDATHEWHKHFFRCSTVWCVKGDMTRECYKEGSDVARTLHTKTFLYLNFDGLASSFDNVIQQLNNKNNDRDATLMLSFATSRNGKDTLKRFEKEAEKGKRPHHQWNCTEIESPREDLITYLIKMRT